MLVSPIGLVLAAIYLIVTGLTIIGLLKRMAKEDEALRTVFGQEWVEWAQRVRFKLMPEIFENFAAFSASFAGKGARDENNQKMRLEEQLLFFQICREMASLTTSAYFSHPWFDEPSMKRKHSSSGSGDELHPSTGNSSPLTKRRRVAALERGFSNLSLGQDLQQPHSAAAGPSSSESSGSGSVSPPYAPPLVSDFPLTDASSSVAAMDIEGSVGIEPLSIQPDSVEEPSSPPLPPVSREVRMKGTSWYEPEPDRIVVTDLDSSDDEDSRDEPEPPVVSPALLERIRQRELLNISVPRVASQALVLYRPLNIPGAADTTNSEKDTTVTAPDDDRMDVE